MNRICVVAFFVAVWMTGGTNDAAAAAGLRQITAKQLAAYVRLGQWIRAEEIEAAVRLAARLIDEADGRLISTLVAQERQRNDLELETFVPFQVAIHDRLMRSAKDHPKVLEFYRQTYDAAAKSAYNRAANERSLPATQRFLQLFFASSYGDDGLILLADLAANRGWFVTAREALRRVDPIWQPAARPLGFPGDWVDWSTLVDRHDNDSLQALAKRFPKNKGLPFGSYQKSDRSLSEIAARCVYYELLSGNYRRGRRIATLANLLLGDPPLEIAGRRGTMAKILQGMIGDPTDWPLLPQTARSVAIDGWPTVGGNGARGNRAASIGILPDQPTWLAKFPEESGAIPFEQNGQSESPRSIPVVHQGKVYALVKNRIFAWDLQTGRPWPVGIEGGPLFQDLEFPKPTLPTQVSPLTSPVDSLTVQNNLLVGRLGVWSINLSDHTTRQPVLSRIHLIDLDAEGALQSGYPIVPPKNAQFEGSPLIVGSKIFVGLTYWDDVQTEFHVACFDLFSGQSIWISDPIAKAAWVSHNNTTRIFGSIVSHHEGSIYYHTGQGSIAALDVATGQLYWSVAYRPRLPKPDEGSIKPRKRFVTRHQVSSPVVLSEGRALVATADSDRLMAIDAVGGRILWITAPGEVGAVDQVLGIVDGRVVTAGQRLQWWDWDTGKLCASFAGETSDFRQDSLEGNVRRSGYGLIAGSQVYWPTEETLWVLEGSLPSKTSPSQAPKVIQKMDLRPLGLMNGHLAAAGNGLVIAGQKSIGLFQGRLQTVGVSKKLSE